VVRRTRRSRLGAFALHFTALIEEVLDPGARGEIGDELEFRPQMVEFLLTLSSRISSINGTSSR
jgi:hypothetical protein